MNLDYLEDGFDLLILITSNCSLFILQSWHNARHENAGAKNITPMFYHFFTELEIIHWRFWQFGERYLLFHTGTKVIFDKILHIEHDYSLEDGGKQTYFQTWFLNMVWVLWISMTKRLCLCLCLAHVLFVWNEHETFNSRLKLVLRLLILV